MAYVCHLLYPHHDPRLSWAGPGQGHMGLEHSVWLLSPRSQSPGSLPPHRVTHTSIPKAPHCPLFGSSLEEGNGNPLQCSCLENPRDGGAWWAAVYGVAQSRTRLKRLSSSSSSKSKVYRDQLACSQLATPWSALLPLPTPTDLPTSPWDFLVGYKTAERAGALRNYSCNPYYLKGSIPFLSTLLRWISD